jgi:Uma2 family endonuclease
MSSSAALLTSDEFLDQRFELPEAGQWAELEAGEIVLLQPPDLDHGTTVLNLSKAFSQWAHRASAAASTAYPCFDLGLRLRRNPDTVRFPAICVFDEGPRFSEADKVMTDNAPSLVVELLSSAERRAALATRVDDYFRCGVRVVWGIDPQGRTVSLLHTSRGPAYLAETDVLESPDILAGFSISVAELFAEPAWWTGVR